MPISKRTKALLDLSLECEKQFERTLRAETDEEKRNAVMWLHLDMPEQLAVVMHLTEQQTKILMDIIGMAVIA